MSNTHNLLAPNPGDRPDAVAALGVFGRITAGAGNPAWPAWADAHLTTTRLTVCRTQ